MTFFNYVRSSKNVGFRNWYKTRKRRLIPMLILNVFNFAYDFINHANLYNELAAQGPIMNALSFGDKNASREDCIWRRGADMDPCPDPNIHFYLYSSKREMSHKPQVENLHFGSRAWLHASGYKPTLESVVLVHGYAGITDTLPMGVLRDAYLRNGSYNVFLIDWSALAKIPCYAAAVHNMKPVAKCLGQMMTFLRDSGVPVQRTTCVGHSLGAHICGITSNYILFRMHKIIGLDPARPLIRNQLKSRLDKSDADYVQIIHTSSTFGDNRQLGHVDFCVNGGRIQPFCINTTNEALCSHIRSVCYMAETLTPYATRQGIPCSRRCSIDQRGKRYIDRSAPYVTLGHNTPPSAKGTYCVLNTDAPYCPSSINPIGSDLCCVPPKQIGNEVIV